MEFLPFWVRAVSHSVSKTGSLLYEFRFLRFLILLMTARSIPYSILSESGKQAGWNSVSPKGRPRFIQTRNERTPYPLQSISGFTRTLPYCTISTVLVFHVLVIYVLAEYVIIACVIIAALVLSMYTYYCLIEIFLILVKNFLVVYVLYEYVACLSLAVLLLSYVRLSTLFPASYEHVLST